MASRRQGVIRTLNTVGFRLGSTHAALPATAVHHLGEEAWDSQLDAPLVADDSGEWGRAVDAVHLGDLLGFEVAPDSDTHRLLMLDGGAGVALPLRVDGPVTFRRLQSSDLIRMPVGLEAVNPGPVVAMTESRGELGYVLDPKRLFDLLRAVLSLAGGGPDKA